jgi:AraC-like DNA-binding protein
MILIIQGVFHYIDAHGIVIANPGDIITIEPDKEHLFACKKGSPDGIHVCAHFDLLDANGEMCLVNQLDYTLKRCVTADDFDYIRMLFEQSARDFASYSKFHADIVNATVRLIWLQVIQKCSSRLMDGMSQNFQKMVDYVRANITKPISRQDIARHIGYTPEHINYLFKKELGITPSRFINRERAIHAFNLLCQEDVPIKQAAMQSGFSSYYYFCRVFKGIFGHSPGQIKKYLRRDIQHYYGKYK